MCIRDSYYPVIDDYNPLLRFKPCLNPLGLLDFLQGSTQWHLPALAYTSDRHVTDAIGVMSHQFHFMSAVCL